MEAEKNVVDLQIARLQRQEHRDERRRGQPIPPGREQNGALTARQQAERASLSGDHAPQEARLEQRIEYARARREREGWQPHRETRREATTGEIDRGAENSPVEGRAAGTGETTPENEQATHAQPEAAQEAQKPETEEEHNAAIEAERTAREERDRGYDPDPGRERER